MAEDKVEDLLTVSEYNGDDPIEKLKAENAELKLWQESINEQNNSYRKLFEYLTDECVGEPIKVLKALSDVSHWSVMDYVKVKKSIGEKNNLLLDFDVPHDTKFGVEHHTAEWNANDNLAAYSTRCFEDDWHGYFLFPTTDDEEYLCVWYQD